MTTAAVIVGTTTWGTTLGIILARKGVPVTILARTPEEADRLNQQRENRRLLPGIWFPESLAVDGDVEKTVGGADLMVLAVPSEQFRTTCSGSASTLTLRPRWSAPPRDWRRPTASV